MASYKLMELRSTRAPSSCVGRAIDTNTTGEFTRTGLVNGATYGWRVCAVDAAGNISSGVALTGRPAPEYNPPTVGTVTINGGNAFTNSTVVTLGLSAMDDSGLGSVCLSHTATCTRPGCASPRTKTCATTSSGQTGTACRTHQHLEISRA